MLLESSQGFVVQVERKFRHPRLTDRGDHLHSMPSPSFGGVIDIMGAGLGGHSSLWAASESGVDFAGVISVSTPLASIGGPSSHDLTPMVLQLIQEPKLFVAGAAQGAEASADAQSMYAAALEPKQLALLPSGNAGPELFTTGSAQDVQAATQLILDFLARNS